MTKHLYYLAAVTLTWTLAWPALTPAVYAAEPEPALPVPEPAPAPVPAPVPPPSLAPAPTLMVVDEPAPTPEPGPARRYLEVSITGETTWIVSDSRAVTSTLATAGSPLLRVGWSPLDELDLHLGWRALGELHRDDMAWDLRTGGNAVVVGARGRYRILPWLALVGELDLEAMAVDTRLEVGSRRASSSTWTFGAIPKLGIETSLDVGALELVARLQGGYAFRTGAAFDDVRLSSEADSVVPIDLGTLDLSGPVIAFTFALRF